MENSDSREKAAPLIAHELDIDDPMTHESRAALDFFRSMSVGKIIAVVGSGTSTIYGYDSWGDFGKKLSEFLIQKYRESEDKTGKPLSVLMRPIGVWLCDKVLIPDMEEKIKDRKLNDAERLAICSSIIDSMTEKGTEGYQKEVQERFSNPKVYKWSDFANNPLSDSIKEYLTRELKISKDSKNYLPPDLCEFLRKLPIDCDIFEKSKPSRPIASDQRISAHRNLWDPLLALRTKLEINRFVTFNYDLEIERLLEDLDYPYKTLTQIPEDGSDKESRESSADRIFQSRSGATARSISLSAANAPDLIALAAVPNSANDLIVHAHGAITRPDDMVITSSKYNALYYDKHVNQLAFEDARNLLFGGNAVVYIGVGLEEEDLMRPLRYLSANVRNRPIYAFMPLLFSEARSKALALKIRSNYGVNVITYGRAKKNIPPSFFQSKNTDHPLDSVDDDFCSLGDELLAIEKCFEKENITFNLFKDISKKRKIPRLNYGSAIVPGVVRIMLKHINNKKKWKIAIDPQKIKEFEGVIRTIAISTALIQLMDYLHQTSIDWQNRFISGLGEKENTEVSTDYGCVETGDFFNDSDEKKILEMDARIAKHYYGQTKPGSGILRIIRFDQGAGKGRFISQLKQRFNRNKSARIISMDYTMRAKVVMSDILEKKSSLRFLCLHNADRLLDEKTRQPINIFTLKFIQQLRDEFKKGKFDLVIVVRDKVAADLFERAFFNGIGNKKSIRHDSIDANDRSSIIFNNDHYDSLNLKMVDKVLSTSRWSNLLMQGVSKYFDGIGFKADDMKSFYRSCNDLIANRFFGVDRKYLQSAFCGVVLEERQLLTQSRVDTKNRKVIIAENIILKWMFAIGIAIDARTINRLPEILELIRPNDEQTGSIRPEDRYAPESMTNIVEQAILSLKKLALVYELSINNKGPDTKGSDTIVDSEKHSPEPRYLLHGAVRQYLARKRGLSFDRTSIYIPSSVTLSVVLTDGGAMLSREDYSATQRLFENLVSSNTVQKNRIIFRSAYALLKGNLYTQCAMRAGLAYRAEHSPKTVLSEHLGCLARLRTAAESDLDNPSRPILYRYDRIWLMNELGVVRFLQGNCHDAAVMFRNILDSIDDLKDKDVSLELRVLINLALCLIERANFGDAMIAVKRVKARLDEIGQEFDRPRSNNSRNGEDRFIYTDNPERRMLLALTDGCKAQIELLTAHLDAASASIRSAFEVLGDSGTLGVRSWLHQIDSAISMARNQFEDASDHRTLALAAARGSQRPDLILSVETSEVEFLLKKSGYSRESVLSALTQLNDLERTATKLGSYKMRVAIGLIRSRALLTIEQVEGARSSIIESISLAQLNGMRLKRISGLILLVALMALRGEEDAAKKLLKTVKLSAIRSGYVRAILDIEVLEQSMGIEGGIARWAGFVSDYGSTPSQKLQQKH